jgi:hypothetical protein
VSSQLHPDAVGHTIRWVFKTTGFRSVFGLLYLQISKSRDVQNLVSRMIQLVVLFGSQAPSVYGKHFYSLFDEGALRGNPRRLALCNRTTAAYGLDSAAPVPPLVLHERSDGDQAVGMDADQYSK